MKLPVIPSWLLLLIGVLGIALGAAGMLFDGGRVPVSIDFTNLAFGVWNVFLAVVTRKAQSKSA